jgi:hypothetical protein
LAPSGLKLGWDDAPLPLPVPAAFAETRLVVPLARSRTNTSCAPLPSPATRFDATLTNATFEPSGLITAPDEAPFPAPVPEASTLTSALCHFTQPPRTNAHAATPASAPTRWVFVFPPATIRGGRS